MKYKLVKTAVDTKDISSLMLQIISNPRYVCDSSLETEDRIIVRYLRNVFPGDPPFIKANRIPIPSLTTDAILYIHFSKKLKFFTKICVYEEEKEDRKE